MEQRITQSTFTGGRAKSGDRGLASLAKQTPIPCSGSFTEACTVFSEGWTGLGRALVAGARVAAGTPCTGQTPVVSGSGEVERARRSTVEVPGGFIGAGVGNSVGWALARRGACEVGRGRALARAERVEHVEVFICPCSKAC
jgi:hypothetical protein